MPLRWNRRQPFTVSAMPIGRNWHYTACVTVWVEHGSGGAHTLQVAGVSLGIFTMREPATGEGAALGDATLSDF